MIKERIRPPRTFMSDGQLRAFDVDAAIAQNMVSSSLKWSEAGESYVRHLYVAGEQDLQLVLVTSTRIVVGVVQDRPVPRWQLHLSNLIRCELTPTHVVLYSWKRFQNKISARFSSINLVVESRLVCKNDEDMVNFYKNFSAALCEAQSG